MPIKLDKEHTVSVQNLILFFLVFQGLFFYLYSVRSFTISKNTLITQLRINLEAAESNHNLIKGIAQG